MRIAGFFVAAAAQRNTLSKRVEAYRGEQERDGRKTWAMIRRPG
jgi:hypothetical protein